MIKTISKKELYTNLKEISDAVMLEGVSYTVFQNSKPAFCIVPLDSPSVKKYAKEDLYKFIFTAKDKSEKSLALNYKKYLYK